MPWSRRTTPSRIITTSTPSRKAFAGQAEMLYNRQPFQDHDSIRAAHDYMGFAAAGAFEGLR
jgi:hypothetical protein